MHLSRTTLLLLILIVAAPIDASALVMCARVKQSTGEIRSGTPIRLRAECRAKEVQVDPEALGLQGSPGSVGPPGLPGADGVDGLSCWDLDADLTCDIEEDANAPFGCGPEDCAGPLLSSCTLRGLAGQASAQKISTACESGERCVVAQCNSSCIATNALMDCEAQITFPTFVRAVCCE